MLRKIQRVPVLCVSDAEYQVYHRLLSSGYAITAELAALGEYAGAIGEGVAHWGTELPEEGAEAVFQGIVDVHVLVRAKVAGEVGVGGWVQIRLVEVWGRRGEFYIRVIVVGWCRRWSREGEVSVLSKVTGGVEWV